MLVLLPILGGSVAARAAPVRTHTIVMDNVKFGPAPAGLKVGDTIVWDNRDLVPHTATARDGSFDVVIQPGHSAKTVMHKAGTIAFYCRYHPDMKGSLVVARWRRAAAFSAAPARGSGGVPGHNGVPGTRGEFREFRGHNTTGVPGTQY
jgi:plastocyanin